MATRNYFRSIIITNALIGTMDLCAAIFLWLRPSITVLLHAHDLSSLARFIDKHLPQAVIAAGIFYFASHAVIKLFLAWALLRKKLWAYPIAIVFFALFSLYQIIDLAHSFSPFVAILLLINLAVLLSVTIEYRRIRGIVSRGRSTYT